MSSINTVSGNGNKNYVSGLASGMDTESIVKSLLMGTQTKIDTVSYTHLRAHETGRNLVCRLLLEKKKKDMPRR